MSDQQCRFLFDDADIRGEVVQLADALGTIMTNNDLPKSVQSLLGEFVAAATLMSATLKFEGLLTLQARGSGPLSLIMAECTDKQEIRAVARTQEGVDASTLAGLDLQQLIGADGVLAIIIEPDQGERYQGLVPLDAPQLASCLEHYFRQSEQINTRLWLACDGQRCGGLLLQALPQSKLTTAELNAEHWQTAEHLAATVKDEELLSLDPHTLIYRLLNEFTVRAFAPTPVTFKCSCSRARSAQALIALGEAEVKQMLDELTTIQIDCQFCHQRYLFDQQDLPELFPETNHTLH